LDRHESVPVRDELTGETYHWGNTNYVRLGPGGAHVLVVGRGADGRTAPTATAAAPDEHGTALRPSTPQIGGSPAS
ncbi:hypothetical protein JL475_39500, partial [Streptomyces sp. M2CJ-2]|nr:hypothetical protein [Streptomyces sp. M2CJ-2]